jgi:hypothetical protein
MTRNQICAQTSPEPWRLPDADRAVLGSMLKVFISPRALDLRYKPRQPRADPLLAATKKTPILSRVFAAVCYGLQTKKLLLWTSSKRKALTSGARTQVSNLVQLMMFGLKMDGYLTGAIEAIPLSLATRFEYRICRPVMHNG